MLSPGQKVSLSPLGGGGDEKTFFFFLSVLIDFREGERKKEKYPSVAS